MSMQRYCRAYIAKNNKWYLELADREYGEREDSTTYGPFNSQDNALNELDNHSNPGSYYVDNAAVEETPTISPNGRPVVKSDNRRINWRF